MDINIPGRDVLQISYLLCDYNGTLAKDGILLPGILERFQLLSQQLEIIIVTADTHGNVRKMVEALPCKVHVIGPSRQDEEKLKLLLFNDTQYALFEKIPKPVLLHRNLVGIKNPLYGEGREILTCYGQFWGRQELSKAQKNASYKYAMREIKFKKEKDIIDKKLMELVRKLNVD